MGVRNGRVAGIDLGTTAAKGVVVDEQTGAVLRQARRLLGIARPRPHVVEQDPHELVEAVQQLLDALWPFDAVAVVGQVNTHLLVDEAGEALTPAISWADHRAAPHADARWGATSLVARLRWWAEHEPATLERAAAALVPRDYVLRRLVGHAGTEASSWPDLTAAGGWRDDLPPEALALLPALVPPVALAGEYRGVPAAVGCMDALGAVIGVGPTPPGTVVDVGGTSETAGIVSASSARSDSVRGLMALPEGYWHAGPTRAGGRSLEWVRGVVAVRGDLGEALALAESAPEGPTGIVFLPYLDGERAPIWNARARGVLFGLGDEHEAPSVARAVLEGVAFAIRHVVEWATPIGDPAAHAMVVCGRPARSATWNRIKAEVLGLPAFVPDEVETGALGAAMIAVAARDGIDLADVRERLAPAGHQVEPDPARAATYARLHRVYLDLERSVRGSFDELAAVKPTR
jgi:xylulokinase